MPILGDIDVKDTPGSGTNHKDTPDKFLYEKKEMITEATDLLADARVTSIPTDITSSLNNSPGLRASAFSVGGHSPLNAVAVAFANSTEEEYAQFAALKTSIENDTNSHMYEEGGTNYVVIFTKYKELCETVTEAVNSYNSNRFNKTTTKKVDDDENTYTTYHYFPELSFSCPIDGAPSYSFNNVLPAGALPLPANSDYTFDDGSESQYYQAFSEAYSKAEKFYNHYGEDTITFRTNTSTLNVEGEEYDFETQLTELENNWPAGVAATTPTETEDENPPEEKPADEKPADEKPADEGTETASQTTYRSGDMIANDGNLYTYYGAYQSKDGTVTNLLVDNAGYMCYVAPDGSITRISATYVDGSGHTQTKSELTAEEYQSGITINAHGYNVNMPFTLHAGDESILSRDIANTATQDSNLGDKLDYPGNNYLEGNDREVTEEHYVSMAGKDPGVYNEGTSHETTTHTATSVDTFKNYAEDGNTIVVPQGTNLQWDPSSAPLNGVDFDTSNGEVFFTYSSEAGGYYQVDEYGNIISNKVYTLEGFNNDQGHFN